MLIPAAKLRQHIASNQLVPLYILYGDEPMQLTESLDLLRQAAKAANFIERIKIESDDKKNNWKPLLTEQSKTISLFSQDKLIELYIKKPLAFDDINFVLTILKQNDQNLMVIIITNELCKDTKILENADNIIMLNAFDIPKKQLATWIYNRFNSLQVKVDFTLCNIISDYYENNLIAIKNLIDQLIIMGYTTITQDNLQEFLHLHANFSVFALIDAVLQRDTVRILNIFNYLRTEMVEPSLINWVAFKIVKLILAVLHAKTNHDRQLICKKYHVWQSHVELIMNHKQQFTMQKLKKALQNLSHADILIKEMKNIDALEFILSTLLSLSSNHPMEEIQLCQ